MSIYSVLSWQIKIVSMLHTDTMNVVGQVRGLEILGFIQENIWCYNITTEYVATQSELHTVALAECL